MRLCGFIANISTVKTMEKKFLQKKRRKKLQENEMTVITHAVEL